MSNHVWGSIRGIHWQVCKRCGLVILNNKNTRQAMKEPCEMLKDVRIEVKNNKK